MACRSWHRAISAKSTSSPNSMRNRLTFRIRSCLGIRCSRRAQTFADILQRRRAESAECVFKQRTSRFTLRPIQKSSSPSLPIEEAGPLDHWPPTAFSCGAHTPARLLKRVTTSITVPSLVLLEPPTAEKNSAKRKRHSITNPAQLAVATMHFSNGACTSRDEGRMSAAFAEGLISGPAHPFKTSVSIAALHKVWSELQTCD
jgi:hypothetical protein